MSATRRIELLLSCIQVEHWARKALLGELCDELIAGKDFVSLHGDAEALREAMARESNEDCERAFSSIAREFASVMTRWRPLAFGPVPVMV